VLEHEIHLLKKCGLCRPILIPNEPWESVSMDFMTQLFKWNGMVTILIKVDQFFKLAKMIPTNMIVTTFDLTKKQFDIWVRHHGMP